MTLRTTAVALICLTGATAFAQTRTPPARTQPAAPPASVESQPAAAAQKPPAVTGPDSQTTTATYGDWVLRCQQAGAPARRACEIVQSVVLKGQNTPFAQVAFGRIEPGDPLSVTVVVPHNVSFPSTVRISQEGPDAQPVALAWTRCLATGCFATATPGEDALKRWRAAAQPGRAAFQSGTGQDIVMPVSFRGLAQAIEGLAKETRATP